MIYFEIEKTNKLKDHHKLAVQVDNVNVDFGVVPTEILGEMLNEFQENLSSAIRKYKESLTK